MDKKGIEGCTVQRFMYSFPFLPSCNGTFSLDSLIELDCINFVYS